MPLHKPVYFDIVHHEATQLWDLLDANPKLAGPWRLLFNQVQSPRHVVSELLQNADDAGATWAKAYIADDTFYFEHDGQDFDPASFESICQFGSSNKRRLHTIGFRGIGFKSVFSLGPRVELYTPTLAIAFDAKRFTEPIWLEGNLPGKTTRIQVAIDQTPKLQVLQNNLRTWIASAVPLFKVDPFVKTQNGASLGWNFLLSDWDRRLM